MNTKEQKRGKDFEEVVGQFLRDIGYSMIEEQPKIGSGKAEFFVESRGGEGFFVEAKSPHLMKDTAFDADHIAKVAEFRSRVTRFVKKRYPSVYEKCIMDGTWSGHLGCLPSKKELASDLSLIEEWVGKEEKLPTRRDLFQWNRWLRSYEWVTAYLEDHRDLDEEGIRIVQAQCPVYHDIPSYPFGSVSISHTSKQGTPSTWSCRWRIVKRDRFYPDTKWIHLSWWRRRCWDLFSDKENGKKSN